MSTTKYPPLVLSSTQSEMLNAIFDTFLAELTPEEEAKLQARLKGKEDIYQVNSQNVSDLAKFSATKLGVPAVAIEFIGNNVLPENRTSLTRVLDLLNTRSGSMLLTGHLEPFNKQDRKTREAILLGWKNSRLQTFRGLFKAFSNLCLFNAYNRTNSPLVDSIGHTATQGNAYFENHPEYDPVHYDRIPMMSTEEATRDNLEFDVVVIGSGAGGGVAAAELSKAGYSVLVIEKGKYYHQEELVLEEEKCYANMYDSGISTSVSGTIQCLTGSTLGGGTALNYLVSLKPQHFVREEWAKLGLPHFLSKEFNNDLDRVFERIGASRENLSKTKVNEKFELGCQELGYHIEDVYVNTGGRPHHCGRCMMGCKSGIKQSTANTWLLDALKNGAQFLDRSLVTRILTNKKGTKAVGVECQVHDGVKTVQIKCKKVIVACGALRTPGVLRASGLKNPNIGKHLRLQPILITFGFYNELIEQANGPLITKVTNVSDDCHGDNYGAKIEEGLVLPGGLATRIPWRGAAKHKEVMFRHKSITSYVNVVRDKDSVGFVSYDPKTNNPIFDYALSKHDEKSMITCVERNMKIMVASGAREVYSGQANVEPFEFTEEEESRVDNPRFVQWLEKVRNGGVSAISTSLVSVHQLGSCRMGISPKTSAVQPTGETWDVKNIYVADGSVFPTAVGVNPMVTIEAISLKISRHVAASMKPSRL